MGYLFDHPGTVLFSVFMSFWAVTFLEYWKRKMATLSHHWDCMDFHEEEVLQHSLLLAAIMNFWWWCWYGHWVPRRSVLGQSLQPWPRLWRRTQWLGSKSPTFQRRPGCPECSLDPWSLLWWWAYLKIFSRIWKSRLMNWGVIEGDHHIPWFDSNATCKSDPIQAQFFSSFSVSGKALSVFWAFSLLWS